MLLKRILVKRYIAIMLAMALLIPQIFVGTAVAAETPAITVTAIGVDNGKYLEVGLSIQSAQNDFQSVGAVLKYDPTFLTPVTWTDGAAVTLPTAENFKTAIPLPTKGADDLSGKTALGFNANATTGYFYLLAEAPKTIVKGLDQKLPDLKDATPGKTGNDFDSKKLAEVKTPVDQSVVVRFMVNPDAANEGKPYDLSTVFGSLDVHTTKAGPMDAVLQSSPVYNADGAVYYASNIGTSEAGKAVVPTTSFLFVENGKSVNSGGGGAGPSLTINLAGGQVKVDQQEAYNKFVADCDALTDGGKIPMPNITPAKAGYQFGGWTDGTLVYQYRADDPETGDTEKPDEFTMGNKSASLVAVWQAAPDGFFPITFYDWDGTTLLGTKIVAKVSDDTEQQTLINNAMAEVQKEFSATTEELNGKLWFDDSAKPLTYKKGYSFGKWIDFDAKDANGNEVYTSYGDAVDVTSSSTMATPLVEPVGHAYSKEDQNKGITLKAAYVTNDDMKSLTETNDYLKRIYTINSEGYMRFAATTNYSITVNIKRENPDGQGVHRVRQLGLRIGMTVKGATGTVYALQELANKDEITATVAVNNQVEKVTIEVVDLCDVYSLGGTTNWATQSTGRSNTFTEVLGATGLPGRDNPGFVMKGNLGYISDQAYLMKETGQDFSAMTIVTAHLTDTGFNYNPVFGQEGTSAALRVKALKKNIYNMCISLPQKRALTWDEAQEAIKRGTVWDSASGGWTNGFTGTYVP